MTVQVDYKCLDGWHVFTSENVPGLYVAHVDYETALKDVPVAIKLLTELNRVA